MAPELLKGNYGDKCDVWSCGVILYTLIYGEAPFDGKNNDEIANKIKNEPLRFKKNRGKKISSELIDLLRKLLDKNLKTRFSAQQALNHYWIRKHMKVLNKQETDEAIDALSNIKCFRVILVNIFFILNRLIKNFKNLPGCILLQT